MKILSKEDKMVLIEIAVTLIVFIVVFLISYIFKIHVGDFLFYALSAVFMVIEAIFVILYIYKFDVDINNIRIFNFKEIKAYIVFLIPLISARGYWLAILNL